jgi:PAS domain S-box-containing protein
MVSTPLALQSAIIKDPLVAPPDITVAEAIIQMSVVRSRCYLPPFQCQDPTPNLVDLHLEARSSCIIVVDNQRVVGILTERDLVRLGVQQQSFEQLTLAQVMTDSIITLREADFTDLCATINLLQHHRIRHLPILDEQGELVGLVTHESLRQISQPIDLMRLRLVQEVMTRQVICAIPESSILEVAQQMLHHQVSSVVIVKPLAPKALASPPLKIPVGILSERDLVQFQALGLALDLYQAEAVMSTPIFTVKPEDSLWTVQQTMLQHLIHRLVVTGDQGELLGIITQTSLLQAINPLEIYRLAEVLEARVEQLEGKKITLLQNRTLELEQQVKTSVQQGQQRYESLAAAAPVGIFHTDAMGDYLYVNDRWCGIAGLTREAALGKGWLQGVHPQTRELVAQAWFQSVKNQVPFQLEYRFHSDDGEVTWVQTQAVTEQDLAGQVVGYVGTIIDISDRKRVEQELKRLNHELGMRVAARTVLLRTAVDELQAEVIRRAMLEEDLRDANLRLQELAQTDGLTQVANRRRFDQMLEQEWLRCQREQVPLSLVLFDVDYFKHYNDHNGHQQGDDCLIQLAQASSRAVRRPGDLVARYGGKNLLCSCPILIEWVLSPLPNASRPRLKS